MRLFQASLGKLIKESFSWVAVLLSSWPASATCLGRNVWVPVKKSSSNSLWWHSIWYEFIHVSHVFGKQTWWSPPLPSSDQSLKLKVYFGHRHMAADSIGRTLAIGFSLGTLLPSDTLLSHFGYTTSSSVPCADLSYRQSLSIALSQGLSSLHGQYFSPALFQVIPEQSPSTKLRNLNDNYY